MIPKILEMVPAFNSGLQQESGRAIRELLPELPESKDEDIYNAAVAVIQSRGQLATLQEWAGVYHLLLDRIPFEGSIKEDALKIIASFSDLSAPLSMRCAGVHILIKVMTKMPYSEFRTSLLPKASAMCRDYNWEVR